jgi:ATP-dependent exoDNAse (exonuclease V) beta subunit
MNQQTDIKDLNARLQALNGHHSYIVQAPAGSGKTELLTQRFLVLLAQGCRQPEAVLALTFTRKAAAQMRSRIMHALLTVNAQNADHELNPQTYQLAQAVLARDAQMGWNLLDNPNRLRILTLDAFCAQLVRMLPLDCGLGGINTITDTPKKYYALAAQTLLDDLESDVPWLNHINIILEHLDNNAIKTKNLFIQMLEFREQWLGLVHDHHSNEARQILEQSLQNVIHDLTKQALQLIPTELRVEWFQLLQFSTENLMQSGKRHKDETIQDLTQFPEATFKHLPQWQLLIDLVLTKSNEWRKKITISEGFPAPNTIKDKSLRTTYQNMKERMQALLAIFTEQVELQQALLAIRQAPSAYYNDEQWKILESIIKILPILVARLKTIFNEYQVVDFSEIQSAALTALGNSDAPTELALHLDNQIQHILVDEFQDTSSTQYRLLEMLTAGWQNDDGRTLFLVGDPMQSIYGFRAAEVGLFLRARQFGMNDVKLIPLYLNMNFRSTVELVSWYNQTFQYLFPQKEEISIGAVAFHHATPLPNVKPINWSGVHFQPIFLAPQDDPQPKLQKKLINLIQKKLHESPEAHLAILVRAKEHIKWLLPILQMAKIPYHATEIENLIDRPVIQDLLALTRALLHLADRIYWLAILRAPYCGLLLADCHRIAQSDPNACIWQILQDQELINTLSLDAQTRLVRVLPILHASIENTAAGSFAKHVEQTWVFLGGPAAVQNEYELLEAQQYFELLHQFEQKQSAQKEGFDWLSLQEYFSTKPVSIPSLAKHSVEIMTIHKAKGLEFDVVILCGLERITKKDSQQLLLWQERVRGEEHNDTILAPVVNIGDPNEPIYRFLSMNKQQKTTLEEIRLLYVAATRARHELHLVSTHFTKDNEIIPPREGSLLHKLWPQIAPTIQKIYISKMATEETSTPSPACPSLRRLSSNWLWPNEVPTFVTTTDDLEKITPPNINSLEIETQKTAYSETNNLRAVGIIIHECLKQISVIGIPAWQKIAEQEKHAFWQIRLRELGVASQEQSAAISLINNTMLQTCDDPRAQWFLNPEHLDSHAEFALFENNHNGYTEHIIDRTFIAADGTRWIIDYKTTALSDNDINHWLKQASIQHADQLNRYAQVISNYDTHHLKKSRSIQLALYFPLFSGWIDWPYEN